MMSLLNEVSMSVSYRHCGHSLHMSVTLILPTLPTHECVIPTLPTLHVHEYVIPTVPTLTTYECVIPTLPTLSYMIIPTPPTVHINEYVIPTLPSSIHMNVQCSTYNILFLYLSEIVLVQENLGQYKGHRTKIPITLVN